MPCAFFWGFFVSTLNTLPVTKLNVQVWGLCDLILASNRLGLLPSVPLLFFNFSIAVLLLSPFFLVYDSTKMSHGPICDAEDPPKTARGNTTAPAS